MYFFCITDNDVPVIFVAMSYLINKLRRLKPVKFSIKFSWYKKLNDIGVFMLLLSQKYHQTNKQKQEQNTIYLKYKLHNCWNKKVYMHGLKIQSINYGFFLIQ